MMKKREELPISEELVEKFIEINKRQWRSIKHTERYIFINFSMVRMQAAWIIPKLLYAKGLESVTFAKPVVLTWRPNNLLTKLIESFGFKHIVLEDINHGSVLSLLKAMNKTLHFLITDGTGEGLKNIRVCNINVGKPLYEDILRTSSLSTIYSARNNICIKKIIHLLWTTYALNDFCKKHPLDYAVCDDIAYHEGIFLKLFHSYGAEIYNVSNKGYDRIKFKGDDIVRRGEARKKQYDKFISEIDDSLIQWSEQYLQERYQGKNGRSIDRGAFLNKIVISKEDIMKKYDLDPHKKNIVIMAHTFTDAVFNYGEIYFRDYYDWTEQTLKIAGEVDGVNWILKPHPTRGAYNESEDSIEKMYKKYKKPNIVFLSDDVSTESIKNIADALITIGGNAGAEFACEGIPVVIVGKPYYYGFGYTIEPQTKNEYIACLKSIDQVEHLSKEQIKTAKKVFYLGNGDYAKTKKNAFADEFSILLNRFYKQMEDEIAIQYFESNEGTKKYNDELVRVIIEYFGKHDMKLCSYYKKGVSHGKMHDKG